MKTWMNLTLLCLVLAVCCGEDDSGPVVGAGGAIGSGGRLASGGVVGTAGAAAGADHSEGGVPSAGAAGATPIATGGVGGEVAAGGTDVAGAGFGAGAGGALGSAGSAGVGGVAPPAPVCPRFVKYELAPIQDDGNGVTYFSCADDFCLASPDKRLTFSCRNPNEDAVTDCLVTIRAVEGTATLDTKTSTLLVHLRWTTLADDLAPGRVCNGSEAVTAPSLETTYSVLMEGGTVGASGCPRYSIVRDGALIGEHVSAEPNAVSIWKVPVSSCTAVLQLAQDFTLMALHWVAVP